MFNRIIIAGNLGQDPELRYTSSGQAVANLSVATSESYTDAQGQRQDRTTWWRVSVWGKQAEACSQYLTKGRQVLVEGHINADPTTGAPRTFTRKDGSVGASYEITATAVRFLGSASDNHADEPIVDDIPF